MVSDTRMVGYANPWIRGPQEVYQLNPLTNLDDLDVVYTQEFDNGSNTLEFHLGQTDRNIVQGGKTRSRNGILINNTIEYDFVTLRLSYLQAKLDLTTRDSTQLLGAFRTIGDTLSFIPGQENNSAQAKALSTRSLNCRYVTALATAANTLNQGLNALLFQVSAAQKSATIGLRWDFHPSAALKLQYQHIEIDNNSPGRLSNIQPGFTPGGTVNVFSTAIDFVF